MTTSTAVTASAAATPALMRRVLRSPVGDVGSGVEPVGALMVG
jgi:hypothetical protein